MASNDIQLTQVMWEQMKLFCTSFPPQKKDVRLGMGSTALNIENFQCVKTINNQLIVVMGKHLPV